MAGTLGITADMPFVPLYADFPRVSRAEQAERDAGAEQIVRTEFDQEMPDQNRDALEAEYQQRFGKPAPAPRGFIPLSNAGDATPQHGFSQLEDDKPFLLKTIALNNPATAIAETGANLLSQGVALPVAGLAGLATVAGNALGLTDKEPADVVHAIGGALTYQPRGEYGKAATAAVMAPFEKLAEVGQGAGDKVLDATGSPALATAADTAINALPMAIAPAVKGVKALRKGTAERPAISPEADIQEQHRGFMPLTESAPATPARTTVTTLVDSPEMVQRKAADAAFEALPRAETVDEAIALATRSIDRPMVETGPLTIERPVEIQPGRFSKPGYTDALLGRLVRGASPAVRMEIEAELQRRRIHAENIAAEHQAKALPEAVMVKDREVSQAMAMPEAVKEIDTRNAVAPLTDEALSPSPRAARWALIEADDLKPSRDMLADEQSVQGIVSGFDPKRLTEAADDATGAPVVARSGIVEAGDKRAAAIQRVYQANGVEADGYRQHLRQNSGALGLDPAAIDSMRKPVLIRLPEQETPHRAASTDSSAAPVRAKTGEAGSDALLSDVAVSQDMAAANVQNGTWNPGANYTPFVDDARAPVMAAKSVADLPDPIRREQIIGDLAKALDTTIYEGRVKGEKRLGFFRSGVDEVRIKRANDIEVAAHEVAHLIDHRIPELQRDYLNNKVLRDELRAVSYDRKNIKEGFAEAVRLWTTQPEALEAKAPTAHAWLEGFANTHKYGPALRKAQEQMTGWFGQDALNRARSKIGSDKPLAEYFDGFWDNFRQSTTDDLHGVYRMEREMTGKVAPNGPYESARLSRASASIADGAVRFGYPVKQADASFKYAGKGLEEILKPVAESMDDSLLYFVGRSARELLLQKREHLFTKGEVDAMLKLRTPERDQAFREYQDWNKGILDFAEAQGVINPETRRLWKRTQYLPFHRVEQPGGIKGKPGDWSGIQALTGGTTNIKDVLGNMIGNAAMLLDKAVKNEARLKVARLSQMQGGGKYMVKIDPGQRKVKIGGDQVLEAMLKKYGIAIDGDAPAFFEFLIKGQPPAGSNVVAALQHGKPVWFEVGDPILYRALTAIDRPVQSEVVRWLGLPKRVGQLTITATADFWMANIARDTIMGSVMSRAGFRPILDSLDGMRMRMTSDPLYKDWVANGGGMSSIYLGEGKFRTKLEKFYRDQGIDYHTVVDSPAKLMNMVETLGDAFESSTRLGEYKRSLARGDNPRHAAMNAREVSTDFAMKGDSKALGFMYDTVMFLRPALVSWDRLYRGVAHDPNKGAIAAKAGTIAMLSAGLYLLNKDDPRYADLPDWDRDANWHFFVGEHHFRYPKIWEIGAMASAAERSVEKVITKDPKGLGKDFARIIANTFHLNLMPQIAAPLVEQATNRNSFTKAPIETPGMENVQPFLRSKSGTSETMKSLGMATRDLPESLQVNPARAEALLRGYFNTWALYGLMLSDQALFGDKLPEKRTDELPVVRRFYSQEPAKHTRYESEFYELLTEAKRLRGTMRELDEMGLRDFADIKEQSPLATEAKPLERAQKSLTGINNDMQAVRRDQSLMPAEKRQKLDALTVERNAMLKAAVTDSKNSQGEKTP